jgi:hypothetical protein
MTIWSILLPFGIFYCHLIYFMVIGYMFSRFGMCCTKKSGNPAPVSANKARYEKIGARWKQGDQI